VDKDWELVAQMVFGAIEQPAGDKAFKSVDSRLKVFG
jgi:predicted oxidoreductase (fatty acid repression mutant protein)